MTPSPQDDPKTLVSTDWLAKHLRDPDLRVNVRLSKSKVIVSIDLSGDSLHRRGYRVKQGSAPMKENLAAGILIRAGWRCAYLPS